MNADARTRDLAGLDLLASALAGRDVDVALAAAGMAAWTDGTTVHLSRDAAHATRLQELCVQAVLLAAGSLDATNVRALARRNAAARRYLALEGARALAALDAVLPPWLQGLADHDLAARTDSPATSLRLALGKDAVGEPPAAFGAIRVRELLARAATLAAASPPAAATTTHIPRQQAAAPLAELDDEAEKGSEDTGDFATSPVGGGGGLGKLLQNLFERVRNVRGGGPPGADAPTHTSRSGPRAGARSLPSTAAADRPDDNLPDTARGRLYPEWDLHRGNYRLDWCTVTEQDPPADNPANVAWLDGFGLRRPLARLGMGLERCHRRAQGDDIDIDAAIEAEVERLAGGTPGEAIYIESLRARRDLSVLILLDVSGSVTQPSPAGGSVHEQQRRVAAGVATVLHEIGDRVALYAFHSQGRAAVHLIPVKRFSENLDSRTMRRLHGLVPGAYSRLGAAIRHGATLLIDGGGTARRLLLVLSDGLAYDHGYKPAYGAADARRALAEARRDGVGCLCLTVGASTDAASLSRVFGSAAHAVIPRADQLGRVVGPLVRTALRNAEVRRRTPAARPAEALWERRSRNEEGRRARLAGQ